MIECFDKHDEFLGSIPSTSTNTHTHTQPSMVLHICKPSIREIESCRPKVRDQPLLHICYLSTSQTDMSLGYMRSQLED